MIKKRILVSDRVRRPAREGFSWIDRRFLRDHASKLSHDAILLYFFLAAVSDKHGVSFYRDTSIAVRLRVNEQAVARARQELIAQDLIAYQMPLTQVLSIPQPQMRRGGLEQLGQVFGTLHRTPPREESP